VAEWNLDRRATAAAVVLVFGVVALSFAAEWIYQAFLGRAPEPVAHGLKVFFYGLIFLHLQKIFSLILRGQPDPFSILKALPLIVALVVVIEAIRAFI
jgi:Na+-driven multidrug efflux pump